jgi:hypothetical protein
VLNDGLLTWSYTAVGGVHWWLIQGVQRLDSNLSLCSFNDHKTTLAFLREMKYCMCGIRPLNSYEVIIE